MSTEELARLAEITPQTLANIEKGRVVPRETTLEKLKYIFEQRGIGFTNGDKPSVTLDRSKAVIPL